MKVIVDGKEIELIEDLEPGAIELDQLTKDEKTDLEDTIEVTEDMLETINEIGSNNNE